MNQLHTPLYDALVKHAEKHPTSFHVPGHKNGKVFSTEGRAYFNEILKMDATEITGLDDLHDPEGIILESESLLAKLYGVDHSFFLINGSTVGNLSMIFGTCEQGDVVLVQRNSHKSVLNALQLLGVKAVFLHPDYDESVRVPTYVPYETVKEAILTYPDAKALILTNPNYYGMAHDLTEIITLAHSYKLPVLVDEAHGAHFILNGFPKSAIECGADVIVHSAHKTLPAMTMGSYLHVNSRLVDITRIKYYLQVFQSTSPSYPIMASLDLARSFLAKKKAEGSNQLISAINQFKKELQQIPQIRVVESSNKNIETDQVKLTIQTNCQLNGYELQQRMEEQGVFIELADIHNILLILPIAGIDQYNGITGKIKEALKDETPTKPNLVNISIDSEKIIALPISYKDIKGYNKKVVLLHQAIGEICGEMVIPYPPGVPILMVGEEITSKHIDIISTYKEAGAHFQGGNLENNTLVVLEKS